MFIEQKYYIGFRDVTPWRELTNTSLLGFLENNAGIHSNKVNNGMNNKTTWILLAWKVKVIKRPKYSETVNVKTWSRSMDKIYAYRDYNIYNENNELVAIASSKWIYLDIESGKILKLSEDFANQYEQELVYAFENPEEAEFNKLKEPETYNSFVEFKITRNMIDTNHHLHNIYYLDIAKEVIPEKYFIENEFDNFEIMYKKEIKCGEIVKAFYTKEAEKHIVTIKSYDEKNLHAIISFE